MEDRIRNAVADGRAARTSYYQAIALDDEQEFGPPASEADLQELERRFGRILPPTYRAFMAMHDGWRMAGGAVNLLPVRDVLDGPQAADIRMWKTTARAYGDEVAVRSLVIGVARETATRWLLDPDVVTADGEWRFVEHHHGEEESHASFLAWLEDSVHQYRSLAADPYGLDEDADGHQ